jgi:pimeloyl-ACP methyl ester carboxylesterase
MFGP